MWADPLGIRGARPAGGQPPALEAQEGDPTNFDDGVNGDFGKHSMERDTLDVSQSLMKRTCSLDTLVDGDLSLDDMVVVAVRWDSDGTTSM